MSDTLMRCFCLAIYCDDGTQCRQNVRAELMDRLEMLDDNTHTVQIALEHRLGITHQSKAQFIKDNRREGFVDDKYVFAYLLVDLYPVGLEFVDDNVVICEDRRFRIKIVHNSDKQFELASAHYAKPGSTSPYTLCDMNDSVVTAFKTTTDYKFECRLDSTDPTRYYYVQNAQGHSLHYYINGVYECSVDPKQSANTCFLIPHTGVVNICLVSNYTKQGADRMIQIYK